MGECAQNGAKALSEGEKSLENTAKESDFAIGSWQISHGEDLLSKNFYKLSFSDHP